MAEKGGDRDPQEGRNDKERESQFSPPRNHDATGRKGGQRYGRIELEFVSNEKSRMRTFLVRKKTLLWKAEILSKRCDADVCVIIFGPERMNQPVAAETWPSNPDEVIRIIDRFRTSDQPTRCYTVSDYFAEKKKKIDKDIKKLHKQIDEHRLNCFSADQLRGLLSCLDAKMEEADRILSVHKENQYAVVNKGSSLKQACSQHSPNVSNHMENLRNRDNDPGNSIDFLQLSSNSNPFDVQLPITAKPEQSSQMATLHADFLQSNNNNGYLTDLLLFSEPKPSNTLSLVHYLSKPSACWNPVHPMSVEDEVEQMLIQNHNSHFGWNPSSSNGQYINAESCVSCDAPTMQTTHAYMQFPRTSFHHQMHFPEVNETSSSNRQYISCIADSSVSYIAPTLQTSIPHQMHFSEVNESSSSKTKYTAGNDDSSKSYVAPTVQASFPHQMHFPEVNETSSGNRQYVSCIADSSVSYIAQTLQTSIPHQMHFSEVNESGSSKTQYTAVNAYSSKSYVAPTMQTSLPHQMHFSVVLNETGCKFECGRDDRN